MKRRRHNSRRLKTRRSYLDRYTVQRRIEIGLRAEDDGELALLMAADLRRFLMGRRRVSALAALVNGT